MREELARNRGRVMIYSWMSHWRPHLRVSYKVEMRAIRLTRHPVEELVAPMYGVAAVTVMEHLTEEER